jgi:hypothetical protein
VSLGSAAAGVAVMAAAALTLDGAARIGALGLGHSLAYTVGMVVLAVGLARRTRSSLWPAALGRILAVGVVAGGGAWALSGALLGDDPSRLADLAVVAGVGLLGAGLVLVAYQLLGVRRALTTRESVAAPPASTEVVV